MSREKTRQKNIRLPESLLADLAEIAEKVTPEVTQTDIIISGTKARIRTLKRRIEQKEAEAVGV